MNGEPMHSLLLALLMAAAGAMIAMSAAMWRAPRPLVRWTGVVFDLAVAAYALKLWNDETHILPAPLAFVITMLAAGTVGWFWVFVMTLFQDTCRITPLAWVAVGVLTLVAMAGMLLPDAFAPWCWLAANIIQVAMALHALVIVVHGWKGDLVETRRRLRGPFLVTVIAYILAMRAFEIWDVFGTVPEWYPMANAVVLFLVCFAGSFVFIESRSDLFGTIRAPQTPKPALPVDALRTVQSVSNGHANGNGADHGAVHVVNGGGSATDNGLDRAAKADLDRLQTLMGMQQVWREEGLTIASLAIRANMPEAQVRRLISDCLGYRNFPSFVNAHRIAAAKSRLADPNEARVPVSAIAYDIGFGSLGPFNRAFREVTGVSPSEWRRSSLGLPSPISEDA
ncbi:MAG: helix-turn-helix domain-containing protein [Hyphomonadaceae bacterium]|nr:helix-turn-helix domain-containing protein [Hyphomonadaceae bacterium]